jgi:Domain of unknown function (DUF6916)
MTPAAEPAKLTIDHFAPLQHATFDLHGSEGVVPLQLVKVESVTGSIRPGGAFSLIFATPAGPWLPQGIYRVTHPERGTMEIFLVPIGPIKEGNGYQAVFG